MTLEELHKIWDKKNKGKEAPTEHDLQVACVRWFRYQYPEYATLLMAIPNGGWRNEVVAAKLKAEGVVPGVPDLFLAIPRCGKAGLWIEMKNGKAGRLSDLQREMIAALEKVGYACIVCHTFDQFFKVVTDYLSGV